MWLNPVVNAQCSSYISLDMAAPFVLLGTLCSLGSQATTPPRCPPVSWPFLPIPLQALLLSPQPSHTRGHRAQHLGLISSLQALLLWWPHWVTADLNHPLMIHRHLSQKHSPRLPFSHTESTFRLKPGSKSFSPLSAIPPYAKRPPSLPSIAVPCSLLSIPSRTLRVGLLNISDHVMPLLKTLQWLPAHSPPHEDTALTGFF